MYYNDENVNYEINI